MASKSQHWHRRGAASAAPKPLVRTRTRKTLIVACALCAALFALCTTGCSSQTTEQEGSFLVVDGGEDGYSSLSTDMGASPAGKTTFDLVPAEGALEAYQERVGSDASVADMLADWAAGVSAVVFEGRALESRAFDEWEYELTDPDSDRETLSYYEFEVGEDGVQITLPVALFDTASAEIASGTIIISSEGFDDVEQELRFRSLGATSLVVRVLDASAESGAEVRYEYTFTDAELRQLAVQQGYESPANCGMAGLRSSYAEGVYLTDVLAAAGVNFGPGMSLQLRTTDYASTNNGYDGQENAYYPQGLFTYEELMGETRYWYPAMWDDATVYEELGGQTVYALLAADKDVWKGDDDNAVLLRRIIGESKVELESPLLAWAWNEGVVAWGGTDPSEQRFGENEYNPYTRFATYKFLYGMTASEDGSIEDENTTFANSFGVFGIDIIDPTGMAEIS